MTTHDQIEELEELLKFLSDQSRLPEMDNVWCLEQAANLRSLIAEVKELREMKDSQQQWIEVQQVSIAEASRLLKESAVPFDNACTILGRFVQKEPPQGEKDG